MEEAQPTGWGSTGELLALGVIRKEAEQAVRSKLVTTLFSLSDKL